MKRFVLGLVMVAGVGVAGAQPADDETYDVDGVTVVSAVKLPVSLDEVAASLSILSRDDLRFTPAQSIPDVLSSAAGLHVFDFAGNGMTSSAESRGFAAQRETSHLQFLVDGLPFMDFADDNALWNLFDLDQLDRIEVMRSASSSLHGNASFTGVVNAVPLVPRDRWSVSGRVGGGSHGRFDLTQTAAWLTDGWSGTLSGRWRQTDGWRDHSQWKGGTGYASARIPLGRVGWSPEARVGVLYATSDGDLPGPLTRAQLQQDPTLADTPLDTDASDRIHGVLALESSPRSDHPYRVSVQVSREDRSLIETIAFNTQGEDRLSTVAGGQATWRLGLTDQVQALIGVEGSTGSMTSQFNDVSDVGVIGALSTKGDVARHAISEFARLEVSLADAWSLGAGVRRDDLWSDLKPTDDDPSGITESDREMNAWSPHASINYRWRDTESPATVNAFIQAGRSFKAPTLVQLYELRQFDIDGPGGFPPFSLSSSSLDPQFADQIEVGLRARFDDSFRFDASVFALETEDEIGFDLSTFSFANIGVTTHRGFETNVMYAPWTGIDLQLGHTFNRAVFEEEYADLDEGVVGKQINNVPKYQTRLGLDVAASDVLSIGARVLNVRDQWTDENNTVRLPNYTTLDVYGELGYREQSVYVKVLNVLDESFSTSGYVSVDAMGSPLPLFFPAPERRVEGGVRVRWR